MSCAGRERRYSAQIRWDDGFIREIRTPGYHGPVFFEANGVIPARADCHDVSQSCRDRGLSVSVIAPGDNDPVASQRYAVMISGGDASNAANTIGNSRFSKIVS